MTPKVIRHAIYFILLLIPILSAVSKHQTGEFIYLAPYMTTLKNNKNRNKEHDPTKKKFRTLTFRLDEDIANQLEEEAKHRQVSLNAITNQALHRFVEWDRHEQRTRMVPVTAPVIRELLDRMTAEEIERIARTLGKNTVEEITLLVKKKVDVDSFVSWYLERMKSCSVVVEDDDDEIHKTYILSHELGYNWSLLHKTILESVFSQRLNVPLETQISSGTLAFRFRRTDYKALME